MINTNYSTDYSFRNRVQLLYGGREYFDCLVRMIREARHTLYLQFYIFQHDSTGQEIAGELMEAVRRGVQVFLQVDAYASPQVGGRFAREMTEAGIRIKWFEPLFRSRHFYFGRRLHHKVVVADGLRSLVGGVNICDRYHDRPEEPAWLDTALYTEGEAAYWLQQICRDMWGVKKLPKTGLEELERFCETIPEDEHILVRIRRNDWVKRKMQIWKSYLDMFNKAEKSITIMSSYFLPGRLFRKRLAQAVNRGVKVTVILAGRSDVMIAKHAERFLYDWLLRHRIRVYEYQPTVLHAKLGVYDGRMTTIGSYNINNISAYASLELNMEVHNHSFARYVEKELEDIIREKCIPITTENFVATENIFRIFWQRLCYSFINNVLNLFTFYFKQE